MTDDYNSTALAFSDISKAAGKPAKCSRDQCKAADLVTIDLIVSAEQRRSERNVKGEATAVSGWLQKQHEGGGDNQPPVLLDWLLAEEVVSCE